MEWLQNGNSNNISETIQYSTLGIVIQSSHGLGIIRINFRNQLIEALISLLQGQSQCKDTCQAQEHKGQFTAPGLTESRGVDIEPKVAAKQRCTIGDGVCDADGGGTLDGWANDSRGEPCISGRVDAERARSYEECEGIAGILLLCGYSNQEDSPDNANNHRSGSVW